MHENSKCQSCAVTDVDAPEAYEAVAENRQNIDNYGWSFKVQRCHESRFNIHLAEWKSHLSPSSHCYFAHMLLENSTDKLMLYTN